MLNKIISSVLLFSFLGMNSFAQSQAADTTRNIGQLQKEIDLREKLISEIQSRLSDTEGTATTEVVLTMALVGVDTSWENQTLRALMVGFKVVAVVGTGARAVVDYTVNIPELKKRVREEQDYNLILKDRLARLQNQQ